MDRSVNVIGHNKSVGEIRLANDDSNVVQKNIDHSAEQARGVVDLAAWHAAQGMSSLPWVWWVLAPWLVGPSLV